jgi:transcriptional regulator GlxA family with amidase domain
VCAGLNAHRYRSAEVEQWLAARADDRTALGSLSTGTYLLARARVLRGYRCTIHWESLAPFREEFPELDVTYALYEIDRDRLTCSGGVAALDMILRLVWDDVGAGLARKVSMQFHHDRIRTPDDSQGLAERIRILRASPKLANAMELMTGNIEKPLPTAEIARRSCLSLRQLERQFLKHRQCTPQRYYLELRLRHARRLLLESRLSVLNVSLATGFASQSHFTKCYREQFGITPNRDRARAA